VQVALNFVKDILGGASEKNGASLGVLALSHEREVVVTDLLDLEEATKGTDVTLLELGGSVDNGGTSASSDSVVISLTKTSETGDVSTLEEVVLSCVRDTLLGDNNIGVKLEDGLTDTLDLDFLHSKSLLEIFGVSELHGGH